MTDSPVCQWAFVNCEGTHVQWLVMQTIGLDGMIAGTVTQALTSLTFLTYLALSSNELTGTIPDMSALSFLTALFLYSNQLTGTIPDLSALTSL
eukprot:gene12838-biopygen8838